MDVGWGKGGGKGGSGTTAKERLDNPLFSRLLFKSKSHTPVA